MINWSTSSQKLIEFKWSTINDDLTSCWDAYSLLHLKLHSLAFILFERNKSAELHLREGLFTDFYRKERVLRGDERGQTLAGIKVWTSRSVVRCATTWTNTMASKWVDGSVMTTNQNSVSYEILRTLLQNFYYLWSFRFRWVWNSISCPSTQVSRSCSELRNSTFVDTLPEWLFGNFFLHKVVQLEAGCKK